MLTDKTTNIVIPGNRPAFDVNIFKCQPAVSVSNKHGVAIFVAGGIHIHILKINILKCCILCLTEHGHTVVAVRHFEVIDRMIMSVKSTLKILAGRVIRPNIVFEINAIQINVFR